MIFNNADIGNEVIVDIDSFFFFFVRPVGEIPKDEKQGITLDLIKKRIERMDLNVKKKVISILYRRSSNDHIHIKLHFTEPVSVLDAFMIRAWFLDDQTRLSLDLARYFMTGSLHEMNRCFDEKGTVEGIKKAGPWIPIHIGPDQYFQDPENLHDWIEYRKRWEIFKIKHPEIFGKNKGQSELIIGS